MLQIRAFHPSEAEYESVVTVHNANWPDDLITVDEVKRSDATRNSDYFFKRLVGELSGEIIATGECRERFWVKEPAQYSWHFNVLPNYAGQGFEVQMYDSLMALLAKRNPRKFFIGMRDDKIEQVKFIEARAYHLIQTEPTSYLDVGSFEAVQFSETMASVHRLGIQIFDVHHLQQVDPEWMPKLWELQWEVRQDVPQTGQVTRKPFEEFEQWVTDPTRYDPASHFVAVHQADEGKSHGGPYVGMTRLTYNAVDPTIGDTHLTGVIRNYRRKGIATALKVHAIAVAKTQGVRRINTMNNETNPMLQLNIRLGFKPGPSWLYYEKVLWLAD